MLAPYQHPEASIPDNHPILWEGYQGNMCDFACEEIVGYDSNYCVYQAFAKPTTTG